MEVITVGKGYLSLVAVITLTILLNPSRCQAIAINALSKEVTGSGHFATIGANMEMEFLMDSEIGRMLAGKFNSFVTSGAKQPNKSAVGCDRRPAGTPYSRCISDETKQQKVPEQCSTFKRGCSTS
ncbi:hypothetical protein COLO4_37998 [Corchorus olitorius]|uniref:Rapid ALkalinization Factor n=1 Tax=Corchorus olitorius TaxID=93759 RepID=A0A1R3FXU7_9ROSI|nr:hypothetical protein COLO4_37998 [Corchorus olitorius]